MGHPESKPRSMMLPAAFASTLSFRQGCLSAAERGWTGQTEAPTICMGWTTKSGWGGDLNRGAQNWHEQGAAEARSPDQASARHGAPPLRASPGSPKDSTPEAWRPALRSGAAARSRESGPAELAGSVSQLLAPQKPTDPYLGPLAGPSDAGRPLPDRLLVDAEQLRRKR